MKRWLAGSSNTSSLDGSTYRRGMLAESTSQQCTNTLVSGKQIPEYPPPDTPSYCLHIGESASMQVSDNSKIAGIHLIKESGADSRVGLKTPLYESKPMLFRHCHTPSATCCFCKAQSCSAFCTAMHAPPPCKFSLLLMLVCVCACRRDMQRSLSRWQHMCLSHI